LFAQVLNDDGRLATVTEVAGWRHWPESRSTQQHDDLALSMVNKLHALLRIIQEHVTNSEVLATLMCCRKGLSR
jgi:hypothetical protein